MSYAEDFRKLVLERSASMKVGGVERANVLYDQMERLFQHIAEVESFGDFINLMSDDNLEVRFESSAKLFQYGYAGADSVLEDLSKGTDAVALDAKMTLKYSK